MEAQPDAELLYFHEDIVIEENHQLTFTVHYDIQVNNRNGDWVTDISMPYRAKNRIKNLEAVILDSRGQEVKKLKKKDISDRHSISNYALYQDDFVKEFQLLHHSYPFRLVYSYTIEYDEYLTINRWLPYKYFNVPTRQARFTLSKPEDYKIHVYQSDDKINYARNGNQYEWSISNSVALSSESHGPGKYELSPKVIVTPDQFRYGIAGSFASWESYGDWVLGINQYCMDLSSAQKEKIQKSVAEFDTDREKIKWLYNQMQDEIRYILVDIDYGGFQSYPASYVATNKYGDCKALTTYMQANLEAIGIESFPVLVHADDFVPIIEDFPSSSFNHIFLCVPIEGDTIWIENTSKTAPFDYPSTFTQNRKGLLLKQGNSKLINLPKMSLEESLSTRSMEVKVIDDKFQIDFIAQYRGASYERYNAISKSWSQDDTEEYLRKNFPISNAEMQEWKITAHERNTPEITLHAKASLNGKVKKYGPNRALFLPSKTPLIDLESPLSRNTELRIRVPQSLCDTITFHIGKDEFSEIILPENETIATSSAKYSLKFETCPEGVKVIRKFESNIANYPPGEAYLEYYQFQKDIRQVENQASIKLKL